MEYELIHQDVVGNKTTSIDRISFLAFVKHATFAGINRRFFPHLPFRYSGLFFEFAPSFFWSGHFQLLSELANDPTETAYLSNRIGRAFADYFSKKLYGARFTHSYECAMELKGFPISGERPDFYCDALTKQFAVEAKGYSAQSISDAAIGKHKAQSKTGPLPVHFSAASVAYNLYKSPRIKFYDPEGDNVAYDGAMNSELRDLYYRSVLNFIETVADSNIQSEFSDYVAYNISYPFSAARQILVHRAIYERSWNTIKWLNSIEHNDAEDNEFYIDVDGIGLTLRSSGR
ncbi:MAG: hypothetical protein Q7T48_09850 [Cellvibrio sp.]|uniref:hypothetical protein n=1 Tax=Cellvibrio sp. TaxID=1965322 RepID=UPI00272115C3|nr:hypothetical protein [Cellvibrio sp.]